MADTLTGNLLQEAPAQTQPFQRIHLDHKRESLFKANRADHPCRIVSEGKRMQRTDLPLRQVIHPAPKIEKIAERFAVQPKRQRINREIAPVQIQLNRTAFDSRERRGVIVKLCSRGNQVERNYEIGRASCRERV